MAQDTPRADSPSPAAVPSRSSFGGRRSLAGLALLLGVAGFTVLLQSVTGTDTPRWVQYAAAAAVVLAAGLWVAVSLLLPAETTGIPLPLAWGLAGAAAVLAAGFGLGWWAGGWTLLTAAVLGYAGAGELVAQLRARFAFPGWLGLGIGALCAGLVVLAAQLLSLPRRNVTIWLVVAAALLAPLAVTLCSEAVLRRLNGLSRRRAMTMVTVGALGVLVPAAIGMSVTHTRLLIVLSAAALLFLSLLIVSSTPADIGVVLVALALLIALTPSPADVPEQLDGELTEAGASTLVALGDSYMSGEGAKRFFDGTDRPGTGETDPERNQCRRAPTAYAARTVTDQDPRYRQLVFLACSGAVAVEIHARRQFPGEPAGTGGLSQLAAYRHALQANGTDPSTFAPALVLLSIGGNDSGFSTIGLTCGAFGDCEEIGHHWLGSLPAVGDRVETAYREVRAAFPRTPVLVVPYVVPLPAGGTCRRVWLTQPERAFVDRFAGQLNATLQQRAEKYGFHMLDAMQNALAPDASGRPGLRLCDVDTADAGVNFLGLRSVAGPTRQAIQPRNWVHNSLHPNGRGHERMRSVLETWLAENPNPPAVAPARKAGADGGTIPALEPPPDPRCAIYATGKGSCKGKALAWAAQEAGRAALKGFWVALLVGVGAWVFGLGAVLAFRARRSTPALKGTAPLPSS